MPEQIEILAQAVTGLLAMWLGLIVLTRSEQRREARLFGLLTLYLVVWSAAIVIQRQTHDPESVTAPVNAIENAAAYLLPVGTLHLALVLAVEGRRSMLQQSVLIGMYAVSSVLAIGAIVAPEAQLRVSPPHLTLPGISGEALGWTWGFLRIGALGAALYWVARALADAGDDTLRRRQLQAALVTLLVGATGGALRILAGPAETAPWIGVSLISLAVILAAYAVFARGVFILPEVAARAFRSSVLVGLGLTAFVGAVIALDRWVQGAAAIDTPIVTAMAFVVTFALIDPLSTRLQRYFAGRNPRQIARARLRRALGLGVVAGQSPESAVGPLLARLTRTLRLSGAAVFTPSGQTLAEDGTPDPESPIAIRLPLGRDEIDLGTVVFGPKLSGLPFSSSQMELLTGAARFVAASLELGDREEQQAAALEVLSAEGTAVKTDGTTLSATLSGDGGETGRLQIFSLGPLRVERNGELVEHWGGAKAGSRQAEACFAFLFDRGERGAAKDEFIELIWPDMDLEHADVAFHRTLSGLRTTLDPGRGERRGDAITFHNDRYRLSEAVIGWSDVAAFEESMAAAGRADDDDSIRHLERARALYRGEYFDDCPFYGDSAYVEERREFLRRRCVDLLLTLGERYERRGDRPAAAASFRQARAMAGDDLPSAAEALARLGLPA